MHEQDQKAAVHRQQLEKELDFIQDVFLKSELLGRFLRSFSFSPDH